MVSYSGIFKYSDETRLSKAVPLYVVENRMNSEKPVVVNIIHSFFFLRLPQLQ